MIEALLLTGGQSRRMGRDKASLPVGGEPMGERIVRLLADAGIVATTVLGKVPIPGAALFTDDETVHGPLDALRRFRPEAELLFVLSVDLPRFDPRLLPALRKRLENHDAAVPFVDGFRQPTAALYRKEAFTKIPGEGCPMDWLDALNVRLVDEKELGPLADATRGANTPEEWARLVDAVS